MVFHVRDHDSSSTILRSKGAINRSRLNQEVVEALGTTEVRSNGDRLN